MTHLWKRGVNLYMAGLLGIGLFVGSLLLLGWSPTEAALPEEDAREAATQPVIEEAISSCLKVDVGDLVVDVIGYQDQGDGTTKILYWVTNTGKGALKEISFGTGGGKPVDPADGSVYSGGMGDYKVTWSDGDITYALQEQKDERVVSPFDVFTILVRDFDAKREVQVVNRGDERAAKATLKLSENSACQGQARRIYQPSKESQILREHVSKREGIPVSKLKLVSEHVRTYPNLEREFQAAALLDTRPGGIFYHVMIDKKSGEIVDNLSTIRDAESAALFARYGKMEKQLYERLQVVDDDIRLPIAVWVNGASWSDRQEVEQAVANRFPESRQALEQGNRLWAVEDPELSNSIRREYERVATERTERRTRPLIDFMQRQFDAEVMTFGSMPSVMASLTKQQIRMLANRPQVGRIYLVEGEGRDAADIAIPTDIVPSVWNRGFDGDGVTIAILEDGAINTTVICLDVIDDDNPSQAIEGHKTRVASMAACDDTTAQDYDGAARGASLLDAGDGSSVGHILTSLQWATGTPHYASIVNMSYGFQIDNNLNYVDRAFDYWARNRDVLIVQAAGNSGDSLMSPAKAWNVLTVGGSDDKGITDWYTHTMWIDSAYINPSGGDREKPEVVAPSSSIQSYGSVSNESGTSYAAPQVAGLAALLIDRNQELENWPEAMKAIIMASATNNISGPVNITTNGGDLHDGAGAINALHADDIAQNNPSSTTACEESCWWHHSYAHLPGLPFPSPMITRPFEAHSGQYVRAAISWWSQADGPNQNYNTDGLLTNLDLSVEYKNTQGVWETVADSESINNNYEMVGFHADETGEYRISVFRDPFSTEFSNSIGIALLNLPYRAGDVNCSGTLDAIDALYIMQADVGSRPIYDDSDNCEDYPPTQPVLGSACDVNAKSDCNVVDALLLLQCTVGLTNAFCPPGRDEPAIYVPSF